MSVQDQTKVNGEKDFERLINDLAVIITNAIVEYMINHQVSPEDLYEYNKKRLAGLDNWIKDRLASLPGPSAPDTTEKSEGLVSGQGSA